MSTSATASRPSTQINPGKIGAVIAQFLSWLTTYWFVEWIMQPEPGHYALPVALSIVGEVLLVLMKRLLFDADRRNDGLGWAGFIIDALINAGGILPKAGRVLTFPPIAALFLFFGVNAGDTTVNAIGGFIIALIFGILLSIAPHHLWRG